MHYCTLHLAKYKVPKSIEFLIELPNNTTGKLLSKSIERESDASVMKKRSPKRYFRRPFLCLS